MITQIPAEVYWSIPGDTSNVVVLRQIRWSDMLFLEKSGPELEGIPQYWAIDPEGEVHWYPQSRVGEPMVRGTAMGRCLR